MGNVKESDSIKAGTHQEGSYSDDFEYSTPPTNADSDNFNNWFWEMYPQLPSGQAVDDWAGFRFKVPAEDEHNPRASCSQLIVRANPSQPAQYQDSEIFNNGCNSGCTGDAGGMQPPCNTPFPNGRLANVEPPYPLTDSCLDEGGMFQQNPYGIAIGGQIKNTPYYPSDDVPYCVEMRVKAAGQTYGTRGWGFWNTIMPPSPNVYFAWFWEFGIQSTSDNAGGSPVPLVFPVAMTTNGVTVTATPLGVDFYRWHDYRIIWARDCVKYFIDGQHVATHDNAPPVGAANGGMAYHCWVDNRLFNTTSPAGYSPITLPIDKSNYMQSLKAYPLPREIGCKDSFSNTITVTEESTNLQKLLVKLTEGYLKQMEGKNTKQ